MQELAKAHASVPSVAETEHAGASWRRSPSGHGTFNMLLSATARRWGALLHPAVLAAAGHPFAHATLADEDLSVDFARDTTPDDRVAVSPPSR